jgi:hypothetical protein
VTKRPVSPRSTGGAGYASEYRLGAVALAALLCGDQLPGLHTPVERVAFQQRSVGHALDNVVLHSRSGTGERISVDFQSKRELRPTPGDDDFLESITAAVKTIRGDPEGSRRLQHLLGLAAAGPGTQLEQLRVVAEYAQPQSDAEGFWALMESGDIGREIVDRLEQNAMGPPRQRLERPSRMSFRPALVDPQGWSHNWQRGWSHVTGRTSGGLVPCHWQTTLSCANT